MNTTIKDKLYVIKGVNHISPKDAYSIRFEDVLFVDIRESDFFAYKKIDVPNTVFIEYNEIISRFEELPKDKLIIIVDSSGNKSRIIVEKAVELGYANFINLIGGVLEWDKDKMPLIVNLDEELHGQCACRLSPQRKIRKKLS